MSVEECPMMKLPDEVLCHIFSLITNIPLKMALEGVCKRFQMLSRTQMRSWSRNHKLEIIIGCEGLQGFEQYEENFVKYSWNSNINDGFDYLNCCKLPINKWPQAIVQFVDRSVVHDLRIYLNKSPTQCHQPIFPEIFTAIQQNFHRFKLKHIEFYNPEPNPHCEVPFGNDGVARELSTWAIANSTQTLESVALTVLSWLFIPAGPFLTEVCSALENCFKLKSFSIHPCWAVHPEEEMPMQRWWDALRGKPLNCLAVGSVFGMYSEEFPISEFLLPICENLAGNGLESLKVVLPEEMTLWNFANSLHDGTRQSLQNIWIQSGCSVNSLLPDLDRLNFLFPNLQFLHLDLDPSYGTYLNEELFLNGQFFQTGQSSTVKCCVFIQLLEVVNEQAFRENIQQLCEDSDLTAQFGEDQDQSWVIIRKAKLSMVLHRVQPPR